MAFGGADDGADGVRCRAMGFGPPGFLRAPATKAVMASVVTASLLVHTSHLSPSRVSLTPRAVLGVGAHGRQLVSRLVLSNLAFASAGEALVGLALLYRLGRDAERRRGTDRYAAFVVFVAAFATAAQYTWLATITLSRFAEFGGKTTVFQNPFTPGPHALVWAHLLGFIKDVPAKTGDSSLVVFGRETSIASSKAPTYALFAQFFFFALFSNHGATPPFYNETGARAVLSVLWSRFVPATLGVVGSLLLRLPWFPLNIEARVWEGSETRPASRRARTARRTKARVAFSRRRWWPSLVRAFFAATFGWLDPGRDRTGAPRVFVAGSNLGGPRARQGGVPPSDAREGANGGFDRGGGDFRAAAAPAPAAVEALTAMGFDEGSVRRALADAENDLAVATESLLELTERGDD